MKSRGWMANKKRLTEATVPTLFALVHPGLEAITADEITRDHAGDVKKATRGVVVFQIPHLDSSILKLRTTEDVFLLAWGSDSLTYRSFDLQNIRQWTKNRPNWKQLLNWHHGIRVKKKGKPTFHIVTQMSGEHGYRRLDAREAFLRGLREAVPYGWYETEENAWVEFWLTIRGKMAVCGVRLSDRTMRHRHYKTEHVQASLRPSIAAAMVRLAGMGPGMTIIDPLCGAGTIVAEAIETSKMRRGGATLVLGGDSDPQAIFCTKENLVRVGPAQLARWDARKLPLPAECVDRLISNPPFGKQLSTPEAVGELYQGLAREWHRVLRPEGRAVLLVSDIEALKEAVKPYSWRAARQYRIKVQGQSAYLSVWNKDT